jgi:hypothetical protein
MVYFPTTYKKYDIVMQNAVIVVHIPSKVTTLNMQRSKLEGIRHACKKCQFDLCEDCWYKKSHPHKLQRVLTAPFDDGVRSQLSSKRMQQFLFSSSSAELARKKRPKYNKPTSSYVL